MWICIHKPFYNDYTFVLQQCFGFWLQSWLSSGCNKFLKMQPRVIIFWKTVAGMVELWLAKFRCSYASTTSATKIYSRTVTYMVTKRAWESSFIYSETFFTISIVPVEMVSIKKKIGPPLRQGSFFCKSGSLWGKIFSIFLSVHLSLHLLCES